MRLNTILNFFFVVFTFCLVFSGMVSGQIDVFPGWNPESSPEKFHSGSFAKLKSSKTVFVYRADDNVEELEKALKDVWTLTEISLISHSELEKIDAHNVSVFSVKIEKYTAATTARGPIGTAYSHIYLSLWMADKNEKGKDVRNYFCNIALFPKWEDYGFINTHNVAEGLEYMYTKSSIKNWNTGFLQVYLKYVQKHLTEGKFIRENDEEKGTPELKNLTSSTLYIPDYSLLRFNLLAGRDTDTVDAKQLLNKYQYKYEIISSSELSKKILESEKPIYFLVYVKSNNTKFISVFNCGSGSILYSVYQNTAHNINESDFKDITSAIKSQF